MTTMLSFRTDEEQAAGATRWAEILGVDRSELLRDALRRHLIQLAGEQDVEAWIETPHHDNELSLAAIADWGPAEEWTDWADAAR